MENFYKSPYADDHDYCEWQYNRARQGARGWLLLAIMGWIVAFVGWIR